MIVALPGVVRFVVPERREERNISHFGVTLLINNLCTVTLYLWPQPEAGCVQRSSIPPSGRNCTGTGTKPLGYPGQAAETSPDDGSRRHVEK